MEKDISKMTDEELQAELELMGSFKVPSAPTPKAPRKTREAKPQEGKKRASWKDALGI